MARHKLILGLIACCSIGTLVGRTLSQTGGGFGGGSGFGRRAGGSGGSSGASTTSRRSTDASREASLKGAVGATDEQWPGIIPKLEKVRQLQRTACIGIKTSSGGGGGSSGSRSSQSWGGTATGPGVRGGAGGSGFAGPMGTRPTIEEKQQSSSWMRWQWYRSWGSKPAQRDDEKRCDALFSLLKNGNASPDAIRGKMDALAKARERRKQELAEARKELRDSITLGQEARLLALGWLD
jgi:hypothetical protein